MAGSEATIAVAALSSHEQFVEAVDLQRAIWGFADIELLPVRLFVVATKVGGQALGAYDGDRMIGFCLAIPGLKAGGGSYLHSHMLGVLPAYNNRGVGRMLKLAQREEALGRGVELIEWTFDPLEIKNAYFNLERLGAIIRRYVANQYGTTTSPLHGGLPTDRCIAEWWIGSDRAEAAVHGRPAQRPAIEASIAVPNDIGALRKQDPKRAREIQQGIGERFQKLFGMGLTVIGFERTDESGNYLLGFLK